MKDKDMAQADEGHEGRLLAEMLALADRLTESEDALLAGQYAHLHARVAALIELRSLAGMML
ncbi:MAG: hypothetical protein V4533_03665 [Pseudomonadota bacterium]|jgi:hypothetical protein